MTRRSLRATTLVFAVIGACLALAGNAAAGVFAINIGNLFPPGKPPPPPALAAQILGAARAIGVTVVRDDTFWQLEEPSPPAGGVHAYDWTYTDEIASALAASGLRWQPIIDYATSWASNGVNAPAAGLAPAHIADYAAYAGAFAARYGPGGTFWAANPQLTPEPVQVFEIWNEPDLPSFWNPAPDLPTYAAAFLASRAAIRQVDPTATVIVGGLVYPRQTIPTLYNQTPALRGQVDGIAVHPYHITAASEWQSVVNDSQTDAATFDVPIYVTEYGFHASNIMTLDQAATYMEQSTKIFGLMAQVAESAAYCWVGCDPWTLYGTPLGQAFASGIASDNIPHSLDVVSAVSSGETAVALSSGSTAASTSSVQPHPKKPAHRRRRKHRRHRHPRRHRGRHSRRAVSSGGVTPSSGLR